MKRPTLRLAFEELDLSVDQAVSNSGAAGAVKQHGSFTYSEGGGETDLIVMTGPLSTIYTKALGVYFAKQPIDSANPGPSKDEPIPGDTSEKKTANEPKEGEDTTVSSSVASESQANDAIMEAAVMNIAKNDDSFKSISPRVALQNQYNDYDIEPDATVFVVDGKDGTAPQTVTQIQAAVKQAEVAERDFLVLYGNDVTRIDPNNQIKTSYAVLPEYNNKKDTTTSDGSFSENTAVTKPDDLIAAVPEFQNELDAFGVESIDDLKIALESLYGCSVVMGVRGFGQWIAKKYSK